MKVSHQQANIARNVVANTPVFGSFTRSVGDEWYTMEFMTKYPNGVRKVNPFPRLRYQIASAVKNQEAMFRLVVLAASCVVTPNGLHRILPEPAADFEDLVPLPQEYHEVITGTGRFVGLGVQAEAHTELEDAGLAMHCLIMLRALVKDDVYMGRMGEKARDIIRGIYNFEHPVQQLFDAAQLKLFRDFIRKKDNVVMGIVRGLVEVEASYDANELDDDPRGTFQVINAGLLIILRYYGYGALTMFLRVNQRLEVDINELAKGLHGTIYSLAITSIIQVMAVYMEPDQGRRELLIQALAIADAPGGRQTGWQYGRVFKEDCMNVISSKSHDTFISYCLHIYNEMNPDDQILNYRPLSSAVAPAVEKFFVGEFIAKYGSGIFEGEVGYIGQAVALAMNNRPLQQAPVQPPVVNNPPPAALAANGLDGDL